MDSAAERMSDFTIFSRVFITSDDRAEITELFWSGLFGDRDNSDRFPERMYTLMLVYRGLEEVSKDATELDSTKLQSFFHQDHQVPNPYLYQSLSMISFCCCCCHCCLWWCWYQGSRDSSGRRRFSPAHYRVVLSHWRK